MCTRCTQLKGLIADSSNRLGHGLFLIFGQTKSFLLLMQLLCDPEVRLGQAICRIAHNLLKTDLDFLHECFTLGTFLLET
ncbi:hypothetical protein D3C79_344790 [compost metagenome]